MEKQINILAAPAHYQLNTTSEYGWTKNIIYETARRFPVTFEAVTGFNVLRENEHDPNVNVYETFKKLEKQPGNWEKLNFIFSYFKKARNILHHKKIDVIHHILPFGWQATFNPLPLLGYTKGIPFLIGPVQTPHTYIGSDNPAEGPERSRIAPIIERLHRATLMKADHVIAINEYSKNKYATIIPSERIIVISPGIHAKNYTNKPSRKVNAVKILSTGTLILRKGYNDLIEAMTSVVSKHPETTLDIVGDGPQRSALEKTVREKNLEKNIIFHGHIHHQKTRLYFENCDMFCLASLSETFGQVYLEAMACGKPIITTRNPGSQEIIEDKKTGSLVPIKQPKILAEKIIHLIEHPEIRYHWGLASRKKVEERFDWSIISREYFEIYSILAKL